MKRKIIYVGVTIISIVVVVFLLMNNKQKTEERMYRYNPDREINIQAMSIKRENTPEEVSYTGTYTPEKESKIGAEIQGNIKSIWVDEGSQVRAGQKLIQIDTSMLRLQLENVLLQIEGLEADFKRYSVLVKADAIQGVQLEKTEIALKSARVQKSIIEEQIRKSTIRAPFNGIVTAKLTEVGAFAAPGQPLLQITDISKLRFTINVPENELHRFSPGQQAVLYADAFPGIKLTGKLFHISSKANPGNNFTVRFSISNTSDLKIKAGMFGRMRLEEGKQETGIFIPASSIIGSDSDPQVYKIVDGKATLQDVKIAGRYNDVAEIENGLNEGDILVIKGFINLFNGANVKYEIGKQNEYN
jgi:membrane fusion protein, multidrug efflux system